MAKRRHGLLHACDGIQQRGIGLGLGANLDSSPTVTQASVDQHESVLRSLDRYSKSRRDMNQITVSQCQRKSPRSYLEIKLRPLTGLLVQMEAFRSHPLYLRTIFPTPVFTRVCGRTHAPTVDESLARLTGAHSVSHNTRVLKSSLPFMPFVKLNGRKNECQN